MTLNLGKNTFYNFLEIEKNILDIFYETFAVFRMDGRTWKSKLWLEKLHEHAYHLNVLVYQIPCQLHKYYTRNKKN